MNEPLPEAHGSHHILEWVVGSGAVALFAVAWIPNVMARNDMHTANNYAHAASTLNPSDPQWQKNIDQSNSAWDSAKSEAYWSYALFGVAGAAAAVEAVLLYRVWSSSSDSSSDTSVGLGWTPGGLTLSARGRF